MRLHCKRENHGTHTVIQPQTYHNQCQLKYAVKPDTHTNTVADTRSHRAIICEAPSCCAPQNNAVIAFQMQQLKGKKFWNTDIVADVSGLPRGYHIQRESLCYLGHVSYFLDRPFEKVIRQY
jgi:hypothetical protein